VTEHDNPETTWAERWLERRRLKRERTGDSPEKRAQRHVPKRDIVDRWIGAGSAHSRKRR
jgi:hypothetical protein